MLARRLSNSEYNNTIRDLTGEDIRPAREFPVDPANTAGFDNSGESLSMSSALLNKYLQAARDVADHMVLTPDGIRVTLFYTKVHDRLLSPLLAADHPPAPRALRSALRVVDQTLDSYIDHARIRSAA